MFLCLLQQRELRLSLHTGSTTKPAEDVEAWISQNLHCELEQKPVCPYIIHGVCSGSLLKSILIPQVVPKVYVCVHI